MDLDSTYTARMLRIAVAAVFPFLSSCGLAPPEVDVLRTLPGIHLVRVHIGDDPRWAETDWDDSSWEEIHWPDIGTYRKILWLRTRVAGASLRAEKPVFVELSSTAASDVYWNGTRIGGEGVPGSSIDTEVAGRISGRYWVPPRLVKAGDNILAIRLSSFHLPGELSRTIYSLSVRQNIESDSHEYALRFGVGGALLLGACYFLYVYVGNRRETRALWLALLASASCGQLVVGNIAAFINYRYPFHVIRLWLMLGFAYVMGAALLAFARQFTARYDKKLMLIAALCTAPILFFWPSYNVKIIVPIIVAAAFGLWSVRSFRPRPWFLIVALVAFLALFIIQPYLFLAENVYVITAGLVIAMCIQQARTLRIAQDSRQAAELRSARLELELLKRQLQPHFLMNTLTAVCEWIERNPATGIQMIQALAEEFRILVKIGSAPLISLEQELELCRLHLQLMSFRRDREFQLRTENVDLSFKLPPAVLHTMIENALTHSDYPHGAEFVLRQHKAEGWTHLELTAPPSAARSSTNGGGLGLQYVRARLSESCRGRFELSHRETVQGWVTTISMRDGREESER